MPEVHLCFSQGTLALRQGTAENTKLPSWARIREKRTVFPRKGSVMHWSGPLIRYLIRNFAPVLCSPVSMHCASRKSKLDAIGRTALIALLTNL